MAQLVNIIRQHWIFRCTSQVPTLVCKFDSRPSRRRTSCVFPSCLWVFMWTVLDPTWTSVEDFPRDYIPECAVSISLCGWYVYMETPYTKGSQLLKISRFCLDESVSTRKKLWPLWPMNLMFFMAIFDGTEIQCRQHLKKFELMELARSWTS